MRLGYRILNSGRSSIFFITTYFCDYILVPCKARSQVVRALEDRGFALDRSAHTYINPSGQRHIRNTSGSSHSPTSSTSEAPPLSPTVTTSPAPPTSLSELRTRTAALLKRGAIRPELHDGLRLASCAGRSAPSMADGPGAPGAPSAAEALALLAAVTRTLLRAPRFFSLTLTADEAPSLLLEEQVARREFGSALLLGSSGGDCLVPLTLDLAGLPLEAPGVVCGVAARLVPGGGAQDSELENGGGREGSGAEEAERGIEMSYLSTAKGAAVMVPEAELAIAARRLGLGLEDGRA